MKPDVQYLIKSVFKEESKALANLINIVNNDLITIIDVIHKTEGKLVLTGIGKSALIAKKIVSSLHSIGVAAAFMHSADALHGDLGMINQNDIILFFSKSGNSPEIKLLLDHVKEFSVTTIAVTSDAASYLAKQADYLVYLPMEQEADSHDLIPTTSAILQLAFGHALTAALLELKSFEKKDFARVHPGGNLGKRLYTRVEAILRPDANPKVSKSDSLKKIINVISGYRLGATAVVEDDGRVIGIITDGDLRRLFEDINHLDGVIAEYFYSRNPKCVQFGTLASDAFRLMKVNKITQLIVLKDDEYCGIIHMHDLIREGIY